MLLKTLAALGLLWASGTLADSAGSVLYPLAAPNEAMVTLAPKAQNGKLLATFEHWYTQNATSTLTNGTAAPFVILESSDNGTTWSTISEVYDPQTGPGHPASYMYQPFLFEFPLQLGIYPAGTILLVGNTVPADGSYTDFFSWRSSDQGQTWTPVGSWQQGGPGGSGIWEPFLYLNSQGQLVAVFSDERDNANHSQKLVHVVSDDGGDTWGPVIEDVASRAQPDRPGMATPNCRVRYKLSDDGVTWNAPDIGYPVQTTDGFTVKSGTEQPLLTRMADRAVGTGHPVHGKFRMRQERAMQTIAQIYCLLDPADWCGTQLRLAQALQDSVKKVLECWSINGGAYSVNTDSNTDLALTGSTGWSNYTASVQVQLGSSGVIAALVTRVSSLSTGVNSFKGYAALINAGSGALTLVREDYSTGNLQLGTTQVNGGLQQGTWYQLDFAVSGFQLNVTVTSVGGSTATSLTAQDSSYGQGMIGLYATGGSAAFQNVEVDSI
ncbi:exo-alpha-sialidase [Lipomyces doorenjongii]|uniref:exo-alpha-sialidase n=1 Tax=Lipomyces doorenjongii TaxID=383834 RepID=UPI0034CF1ACE